MRLQSELHGDPGRLHLSRGELTPLGIVGAGVFLHQSEQPPRLPGHDAGRPLLAEPPGPDHRATFARRDPRVGWEPPHQLLRLGQRPPDLVRRRIKIERHPEGPGLLGDRLLHALLLSGVCPRTPRGDVQPDPAGTGWTAASSRNFRPAGARSSLYLAAIRAIAVVSSSANRAR